MYQHPRFAAASTGDNQCGFRGRGDCLTLSVIQVIENWGDIHCGVLPDLRERESVAELTVPSAPLLNTDFAHIGYAYRSKRSRDIELQPRCSNGVSY